MNRRAIVSVITFSSFILITLIVILLAQGYRLDSNSIYGTGIMVVSSDPTGATLTLNDDLKGATNSTINNLIPGKYNLSLTKEGYFPWVKEVEVEQGKVLTVDALLIPVNPSLAPITSTPANKAVLSPDGQKLAYVVSEGTSAGIWMLDLSSQPFNLARKPFQLAADTDSILFSDGELTWSPNSKDILVETESQQSKASYLISIDDPGQPALIEQSISTLLAQWNKERLSNAEELQANFPEDAQALIEDHAETIQWSPDNLKFLYFDEEEGKRTYYAYDKEEKEKTKVIENDSGYMQVRWFADSQHLMVLEKESLDSPTGSVSLVGIDGSNKQQVFRGTLIGDVMYTYLSGAKIVILTSFNLQEQEYYLYTINLR